MSIKDLEKEFSEICKNCGFTRGSHHGEESPYPYDYCPGHEGRMDWENGAGTTFSPSGKYKKESVVQIAIDKIDSEGIHAFIV